MSDNEKAFFVHESACVDEGAEIGRYAFLAAGAVVAGNVPDYPLMVGVPARQVGWMSRHGHRLREPDADGIMACPESGFRYKEVSPGVLRCLDVDEEAPLPAELAVGTVPYEELKARRDGRPKQQHKEG